MLKQLLITALAVFAGDATAAHAVERTMLLPGMPAATGTAWQPALLVREQTIAPADRAHPVLYVHGGTFPSASSVMFRFNGVSWADELNKAGFSVWSFDFAGFGGSERYPGMAAQTPAPGEPLGRAPEAAQQIARVVRSILAQTGSAKVSIIAHSWGTIATGLFVTQNPDLVDRLVFFGPIARRGQFPPAPPPGPSLGPSPSPWRFITVAEQYARFTADVPPGHALLVRDFPLWADLYLTSDATSGSRTPASVKTPNGPLADIASAWSGALAYDPSRITSPIAIVRGEWDSLCTDTDAAWLLAALTSAPQKRDIRIVGGTHLMHLEINRGGLYRAAIDFLRRE